MWALRAWTSTGGPNYTNVVYRNEAGCVAEAKKLVAEGKANKAKADAFAAAFQRAHPEGGHPASWTDDDVQWECREMKAGGRVITGP